MRAKAWREWRREVPPGRARLVRGAPLSGLDVSAKRTFKQKGYYGLSVLTFRASTGQGIARRARLPHDDFCVTRARVLRRAGFEVRMTDETRPGHASIVFEGKPSQDDIDVVIRAFGRSRPNRMARSR